MTGMDAWGLIAPLIANKAMETETGMEAYVTLFAALQLYDGKHGKKTGDCESCIHGDNNADEFPCRCCKEAFLSQYESRCK